MQDSTLTIHDAHVLAEILTAVQRNARVTWYPLGSAAAEVSAGYVTRAITDATGNFYRTGDIRDACVWMSGIMEQFPKITDVMKALDNGRDERHGPDSPMMTISLPG